VVATLWYTLKINDDYIFRMWVKAGIWPILQRNSIPTVWVVFVYK
jgi:hypothetical protein